MSEGLRFAAMGTGWWSRFQLHAWREVGGTHCVAVYNRTRSKAEAVAADLGIPAVYDDAERLLATEKLDFVDVIASEAVHEDLVTLAATHGLPVICQKPMAPSLEAAERMVARCREASVPFFVHENFRWQAPMRALKRALAEGTIGKPFRARVDMISGFPVFDKQPFLGQIEHFILTDLGSHLLDLARFFFGEPTSLYCRYHRTRGGIAGENVATVMLGTEQSVTVICEMGYAENFLERECFPQTLVFVEANKGSAEIVTDYYLHVTTESGTHVSRCAPVRYRWADPAYEVAHASIVPCNEDLLRALRGGHSAETTAEDNLKTARLVFAAYESARKDAVLHKAPDGHWS